MESKYPSGRITPRKEVRWGWFTTSNRDPRRPLSNQFLVRVSLSIIVAYNDLQKDCRETSDVKLLIDFLSSPDSRGLSLDQPVFHKSVVPSRLIHMTLQLIFYLVK